jgi:hypothetical protein
MILLDKIARRYGKLPSEVLDVDVDRYNINIHVAIAGAKQEAADRNRKKK